MLQFGKGEDAETEGSMERMYYRLVFPEHLTAQAVEGFIANVGGLPSTPFIDIPGLRAGLVFELWGDEYGISHRLGLPAKHNDLIAQLRNHIRGVHAEEDDELPPAGFTIANEYGLTSATVPMAIADPAQVATSVLTSLQPLEPEERAVIQWIVAPTNRRPPRPKYIPNPQFGHVKHHRKDNAFGFGAKLIYNVGAKAHNAMTNAYAERIRMRQEAQQAYLIEKWQGPMFSAICRVAVRSPHGNAAQIHARILNALQASSMVRFKPRSYGTPSRVSEWIQRGAVPAINWPCLLNASELAALLAFPIGSPSVPGLNLGGSLQTPPPPNIPSTGRVVARSTYGGRERPLAIPWPETLRHFYVLGNTGSGKSTLLENCAIQDMQRGAGLVFIDPLGASARRLINCIPPGRERDVIYFDPANKQEVVGVNLFAGNQDSPELVASNFISILKNMFADSWGSRMESVLLGAVHSLAAVPNVTMLEVSEILTNKRFRQQVLQDATLSSELLSFWEGYDRLSSDEREKHITPILTKLQHFSLRPSVRHVVGQTQPGLDMSEALASRKIIIANLDKGALGEDTAALLGSILMSLLWQAALKRKPTAATVPFYCYVDECQDFLNLPTKLGDMLAQARGRKLGLTLANQHLGQLEGTKQRDDMSRDVLANTNSAVYFRLNSHDADIIAKKYNRYLEPADFANLGKYEVVADISTGTHIQGRPAIGSTYPEVQETGSAQAVLEHNKQEYAYSCAQVDRDIAARRQVYAKRPYRGWKEG